MPDMRRIRLARRASPALGMVLSAALTATLTGAAGGTLPAHAAAATCPPSGGVAVPEATANGDVVVRGHGWGHGLGMSQYGAQGAARLGCHAAQILTRYYTGSTVGTARMPSSVLLRMLDNGYRADVAARTGAVTWDLAGCTAGCPPRQPKGSTWALRLNPSGSRYVLWDLGTPARTRVWRGGGPGRSLLLRHSGTVVRLTTWRGGSVYLDRRLRWDRTRFAIDPSAPATQRLDAVQVITDNSAGTGMDKYLWGIAEVPVSWTNGSHEALKAQAIAARTYAAKRAGQVLMPTPADQNYAGYDKEAQDAGFRDNAGRNLRWRAAVDATSRRVVRSAATGAMIDTFYSSSVGGWTEDERYVWGPAAPYLRPVDDSRWDRASSNPAGYRSWARGFSWATLAQRFGFRTVTGISVPSRGSAARVRGVAVTGFRAGTRVTTYLDGWTVRQTLGLLSPGFEISVRHIGGARARPLSGDWDGDGRDEPGWWRAGDVALRMTDRSGHWVKRYHFGRAGDRPVVGDWDGDGRDEVGVFRAGTWRLRRAQSGGPPDRIFRYGVAGDRPVLGRWKGHGVGVGVVRGGRWLLRGSVTAGPPTIRFRYGLRTDTPVVGDWDGDGRTTVGVRRGSRWLLRDTLATGRVSRSFRYGVTADRPVPGDWDGSGTVTAGVARGRLFYQRNAAGGGRSSAVVRFRG